MTDEIIIGLFTARSETAIAETQRLYGRYFYSIAHGIVWNDSDAEEVVNDTYLHAWNTIPPHRPQYFFAYLAKICKNFALDRLDWKSAAKRRAEVVSLTQEMESCIPDAARSWDVDRKELSMILDTFLRTLTPENRMVFIRRYWYMDTVAEIAVRYGIGESAVQMRLNRTRGKLRDYLQKEGIRV